MRSPRLIVPLAFLLALLCAGSALAGDSEREVWIYKKGQATKEFDVTHLAPELRTALDTQAKAKGWKRIEQAPVVAPDVVAPEEVVPAPPAKPAEEVSGSKAAPKEKAADKAPDAEAALRKDIEELVRRGGRLPEGFIPHGMGPGARGGPPAGPPAEALLGGLPKAVGQLLLNYLDAKDDAIKAPIYEALLRDLAKTLVDGGGGAGMQKIGMQMMGRLMAGLQDPAKAPVYQEIMQVFAQAMGGNLGGLMGPAEPARPRGKAVPALPLVQPVPATGPLPFKDAPAALGGARLGYVTPAMSSHPFVFKVLVMGPVDPECLAAEVGLRAGDQIMTIDGKPADPAGVRRAHAVFEGGGKLVLGLRRMDGKTEVLDIEFEVD